MGTYTDCSQGVCSMYCPRFCYIIFPPPPPSGGGGDPSGLEFSPLIVAVIGILVSAFILVCYYTIISKYCRRRGGISNTSLELNENHHDLMSTDRSLQASSASGLDEALIKSITVCKYKKGDGLVEGTDCSVCLSEFEENESLRLLPKCNHAFHLPCIDAWLKSHSSCPLCRSNINASTNSLPHQTQPTQETPPPPPTINVSALEHHHRGNDTILVVQDLEEHPVVSSLESDHGMIPKTSVSEISRSVSLNYSFCHGRVLSVADILRATEDDEEHQREHQVSDFVDSPGMNRSISTGRFMFTRYGSSKGNNSIIPN